MVIQHREYSQLVCNISICRQIVTTLERGKDLIIQVTAEALCCILETFRFSLQPPYPMPIHLGHLGFQGKSFCNQNNHPS